MSNLWELVMDREAWCAMFFVYENILLKNKIYTSVTPELHDLKSSHNSLTYGIFWLKVVPPIKCFLSYS